MDKDKLTIPFLVSLVGAIIIVISFFLPYASASEAGMAGSDLANVSMLKFFRGYLEMIIDGTGDIKLIGIISVVLISIIGLFSLLSLLFAVLKKPVPIIVFNCLNLVVYYGFCWDLEDRGVVPNSAYDLGMAYYIYYISMAILMVGAIWMMVTKINIKKSSIIE